MPAALVDVLAVLALVALLVVAYRHPRGWVEVLAGIAAASTVLATGAVDLAGGLEEVRALVPVAAFLSGILVVSELCAADGLFTAVGAVVARLAQGRPRRMLWLTFLVAALTTAVLSLDATAVLLTPVVAAAAAGSAISARPAVHACVRLANSASLLLPVSNLTNLLALPALPSVSFARFAVLMAPAWLAVIAVEYVGHRLYFASDLRRTGPRSPSLPGPVSPPVVPLVVVGAMLLGFAVLSPLGVAPAWVAWAAALLLAARAVGRGQVGLSSVVGSAQLPFAFFVLCLGVVVAGLSDTVLARAVSTAVPAGDGLGDLLVIALLATALANLVNNLPATLLLVPLVAPLGTTAVLAALVGLGVGSGLTYTGSLANLLWRRTLTARGQAPSARDFHALSGLVTLPALAAGVLALWAWTALVP